MNKNNTTRCIAFLMSILMIIMVLPAECFLSSAASKNDVNSMSFVKSTDSDLVYTDNSVKIIANSYDKEYPITTQFNYAIDYSKQESYKPGELVYIMPSIGFYDNGVTANYIFPSDVKLNNSSSDIWDYERTEVQLTNGISKVLKITNKVTLTRDIVTTGYMQFAYTINPRTMLMGDVTINPICMITTDKEGNEATLSNQLSWSYALVKDSFNLKANCNKVEVENDTALGTNAKEYYWAKYDLDVSSDDVDLHSIQANKFKVETTLPEGAELYSLNGDTKATLNDTKAIFEFDVRDWPYENTDTSKKITLLVKYPKAKFDGSRVTVNTKLDAQYIGSTAFEEIATAKITHELQDYEVKYEGDLFQVTTHRNPAYELSWNSLNRNQYSPFSFYIGGLSRYQKDHHVTFTNDFLEIKTTDGTFKRLTTDEYVFNKVVINDETHFTNAVGDVVKGLNYTVTTNVDTVIATGTVGDKATTIVLPKNTKNVSIAFANLDSTVKFDTTAMKVIGGIKTDASKVMKEGELRNLVNLLAFDNNGTLLNTVDASNYTGSDAHRIAEADKATYGTYVQRAIATQVVTNKSSQINVSTEFVPGKAFSIRKQVNKILPYISQASSVCLVK